MSPVELFLTSVLIAVAMTFLFFHLKRGVEEEEESEDQYSLDYLAREVSRTMNEIINMDLDRLRLNQRDLDSRKELKKTVSNAARLCAQGDLKSKRILTAHIKKILSNSLNVTEATVDFVLPFQIPEQLSPMDKFEILQYLQIRNHNYSIFGEICKATSLDRLKRDLRGYYYDVTEEDIEAAYAKLCQYLSYDDKLNIITQRIYEMRYGLSVVDQFIMEDNSLDSISGGISGITTENVKYREEDLFHGGGAKPKSYESVWVVYSGKPIHLKFLTFGSNAEMIRICKNLSEYGRTGHFTSSEGGNKNHLADGSRVTTFRPNNASQWAFFIRKFGSTSRWELKDLITDQGCEYPLEILKWSIRGCLNLIFSGDQNSGKTTCMRAAIKEIDQRQQIRTLEADFELYLGDAYHDRNILGTRPSDGMGFAKLIELLKASEAHTILFGETASLEHAKHLIDLLLAGTKRVITTGHWPTVEDMISYFVLAQGGYGNSGTEEVERLVARLLNINFHFVKDNDGHRYIDRISEVIPYQREKPEHFSEGLNGRLEELAFYLENMSRKKSYYVKELVVYEEGRYKMINGFSDRAVEIILHHLPPEERPLFLELNNACERRKSAA